MNVLYDNTISHRLLSKTLYSEAVILYILGFDRMVLATKNALMKFYPTSECLSFKSNLVLQQSISQKTFYLSYKYKLIYQIYTQICIYNSSIITNILNDFWVSFSFFLKLKPKKNLEITRNLKMSSKIS